MKTRKNLNKILVFVLVTAVLTLGLVSTAYADGTEVAWRESAYRGANTVLTVDSKDYDPATGTFGGTDGTISYSPGTAYRDYLFGTVLPEAVTFGKVIVDADLSNLPNIGDTTPMYLFDVCDTAVGWSGSGKQSELVIRGNSGQVQLTTTNALNDTYRARFNTDLITLTAGSGVKLNRVNGVQSLRFVAEAANSEADWNMSIYHKPTSEAAPVYTYTIPRSELPDIKCILNRARAAASQTFTLNVDKFKVITGLKIISATDGNVACNAPLSVTFDSALDASTIGGVQLKQGETVIPASVTLDAETGKTVTITPETALIDDESYQIAVPATVKSTEGIFAAETVINIKAVDALYFTNLSSRYNPTAVVTASEAALGRTEISNNELVLIKATGYGSYQFALPSDADAGVYYADMKFTALRVGSSNPYAKIGVRSSKSNVILNAYWNEGEYEISKIIPVAEGYCADKSDTGIYPATGVYDLRLIIMSENDTADWKVLLYDNNAGKVTHGWTVERANLSSFSAVNFELNNIRIKVSEFIIRQADDVNVITADYDDESQTFTADYALVGSGVAIAAAYGADNRLLEIVTDNISPDLTTAAPEHSSFTFTTESEIEKVKLMAWDGFENCKPFIKPGKGAYE